MVIQRWQSAWLFLAAVFMTLYLFMPMFEVVTPNNIVPVEDTAVAIFPITEVVYFIVCALSAVLLFVAVFLYKNLSLQKSVTVISFFLIIAANITCWAIYWNWDPVQKLEWCLSIFMQYGAMIFTLLAWYRIRKDQQLLASVDRLR